MSNPWDKFFWNDWENDPPLKLCSFAAQGLWMRMLCICAKATPKGYLLVNDYPLSIEDMSSLFGKPVDEIKTLLDELEKRGVFSRDKAGKIYSRRIVKSEKKARIARENGKNGGNPSLRKVTEISSSDNQASTDLPGSIPEAISQKERKKVSPPSGPPPSKLVKMPFDQIPLDWKAWTLGETGWDEQIVADVWQNFRDYWQTGKGRAIKREDWTASWRTWCRKESYPTRARASPAHQPILSFADQAKQKTNQAIEEARKKYVQPG